MDDPTPRIDPAQARPIPDRIAAFLRVVRALLFYGQHLDAAIPGQIAHPRFPTLAAGFGTHDLRRILAHVQRGILRAAMLQRYLLARAAQGREIEPTGQSEPADLAAIEALDMKLRPLRPLGTETKRRTIAQEDADDFAMPTLRELELQVRRRSVGRTIAEICLDLGVNPSTCEGAFWYEVSMALWHFGGNAGQIATAQQQRRHAFQRERDARPDTWTWQLWDRPKDAIREMLGYLLGEPPPTRCGAALAA